MLCMKIGPGIARFSAAMTCVKMVLRATAMTGMMCRASDPDDALEGPSAPLAAACCCKKRQVP